MVNESVCLRCEYKPLCSTGRTQPDDYVVITGCSLFEQKKGQTHADRIRAFTDEELARFIVRKIQCPDGYTSVFGPHCVEENGCEECWLEWLKKEAES